MREAQRLPASLARAARPAAAASVILFTAGGVRFAVDAAEVEEIRDVGADGVKARQERLAGTASIDFALRVGLGAGRCERYVVLKPGACSLGVTEVERMTSLPKVVPLPALFRGAERDWYRGLLLLESEVLPLVRAEYWRQAAERPERSVHE